MPCSILYSLYQRNWLKQFSDVFLVKCSLKALRINNFRLRMTKLNGKLCLMLRKCFIPKRFLDVKLPVFVTLLQRYIAETVYIGQLSRVIKTLPYTRY